MILICLKCKNKMEKDYNYCTQCGASMLVFGYRVNVNIGGANTEHEAVPEEEAILNNFIDTLDYKKEDFKIEKKSKEYTTLTYKEHDLLRLKYTDNVQWVKVIVEGDMIKLYSDSPLFETEEKRNQLFWKSILKDKDLTPYKPLVNYEISLINK